MGGESWKYFQSEILICRLRFRAKCKLQFLIKWVFCVYSSGLICPIWNGITRFQFIFTSLQFVPLNYYLF